MSKYGARKTTIDGIKFDSKMESDYYLYLKQMKEEGQIKDFSLQPKFLLQDKFEKHGKKFRAIYYISDFHVIYNNGSEVIIDIKGKQTADFKIKKKLYTKLYPLELKLITKSIKYGKDGWIELEELEKIRKENRKKNK
jgi:hypothetical protein